MELEKCRDMIKQEVRVHHSLYMYIYITTHFTFVTVIDGHPQVGARGTLEKSLVLKDQEIIRLKIQDNHSAQVMCTCIVLISLHTNKYSRTRRKYIGYTQ